MKKKLICCVLLGASIFSFAGCQTSTDTNTINEDKTVAVDNTQNKKGDEAQYVKGLEVTLDSVSVAKKGDDDKKKILSIKLTAKNTTNAEVGFGSNDFIIKVNDKEISPYTKGANFGQMIEKEKSLTGTATFEVPADAKIMTLIYDAGDAGKASWEIDV